ncbi:uncharacterized protein MELLADRAFT_93391 [Melampsora larici-populina 98AG31]|uniref:Uncharacterized protein n=1 Tax=Melampsora larici-populina (strain 98AG31 / pathotype 3-4-7) TaxID=747676 RepID=F4RA75_MELLP|nr:uncharacterized protein MELLADRAFT_93391 [Melampsora larici-populina 98AG31]EGG10430.1 hypothetical protein MELLADRAFT_93391 [Melampsora larici-populina 98AG31]
MSTEPEAPDTARIEKNLEAFNNQLKRTSERLAGRGSSAPPPEIDSTSASTPTLSSSTSVSRGRGRGRGKKSTASSTRAATAARRLAAGEKSKDGTEDTTDPASTANGTSSSTADVAIPGAEGAANQSKGMVEAGLITRDDVSVGTRPARSPSRRNTTAGVGVSPPRGFHSWLAANNYTVMSKSSLTGTDTAANTIANGVSVTSWVTSTAAPRATSAAKSTTPTKSTTAKATDVKSKLVEFVDLSTVDDDKSSSKTAEKKMKYEDEGIQSNGLVAMSDYFAKKLTTMKGYIALSVFNAQWLREDLLQNTLRSRSTKEKLEDTYIGLPVPVKWKMTFSEWVIAFDLFVAYLCYYKHGQLADRFMVHKENVFAIQRENFNWPMAFRYDIAIRTTVMTFRNKNGKIANPAVRNEKYEREAFRETERLKDFLPSFAGTNPYAKGEAKEFINPLSGLDSRPITPLFHHKNSNARKPNARSWNHLNQLVHEGPGGVNCGEWEDCRGNGRNVRGRGRGGGYAVNNGGNREDNRRTEGSGSWHQDERREDRRGNDDRKGGNDRYGRNYRYGGNGKANGHCGPYRTPSLIWSSEFLDLA